jgi:amidase
MASDYVPPTDTEKFHRNNVHFPEPKDNPLGAWAWRCHIQGKDSDAGILAGKTVALKDNISVKDVPMLLGTDFIKDFTPVRCPLVL